MNVCLTIDLDLVDHAGGGQSVDEMRDCVPGIERVLARLPAWKVTWFVRLDSQIETTQGHADQILREHADTFQRLRRRGDEIAWHPHCYRREGAGWTQETDENAIAAELRRLAPLARQHGMRAVRMGWGFHTALTMGTISELGFTIDASAIPRPSYSWETTIKDWTTTPSHPFRPSRRDHRVPGEPSLPLIEIPMTVVPVAAPYDTGVVLRYLDPAYHPSIFGRALEHAVGAEPLVLLTHPYEVAPSQKPHALLAFDEHALETNLLAVERVAGSSFRSLTISECARSIQLAAPRSVPT